MPLLAEHKQFLIKTLHTSSSQTYILPNRHSIPFILLSSMENSQACLAVSCTQSIVVHLDAGTFIHRSPLIVTIMPVPEVSFSRSITLGNISVQGF